MEAFGSFNLTSYFKNNPVQITIIAITAASIVMFKRWSHRRSCPSSNRLDGKTVIITGANTGIGKETALELSRRGASVIIGCRDIQRGNEAVKDIQFATGNNRIKFLQLDLASFQSIRTFSEEVLKSEPQIHILINNAGVLFPPLQKTRDGIELQFGVNHIGHFLLTLLLLDRLKSSAPARIINVSSLAYKYGKINFDDLNSEKKYSPSGAYCQSKLANVYFTQELAKRLRGTNVTVYCLHPGVVNTEIDRYLRSSVGFFGWFAIRIFCKLFSITAKQGAQTTIYCAVTPELDKESGCYYSDCQKTELCPAAKDEHVAKKLWEISETMTGIKI